MCFDDDRDNYTTRVTIRNGHRYTEEYTDPRHGMSWRRRLGLGGSYYPSRYYYRPPQGRYVSDAVVRSNRYSNYGGYSGYSNYAPGHSHYGSGAYYPQGVVSGGYAGYPQGVYDQAGYQRGIVSGGYAGYSSGYGRYQMGARVAMPRHAAMRSFFSSNTPLPRPIALQHLVAAMEAYPKPRHQYIYTPRYGQRGVLTYAGQSANSAPVTGVIPNGGFGYGMGMGMGMGMGVGVGMGVGAGSYYPVRSYQPSYSPYQYQYPSYGASYYGSASYYPASYAGYYNAGLYGSQYPLANFYYPYQRSYYTTVPSYGYSAQAYVYPPGQSATTTTTTYHVANGHASNQNHSRAAHPREDIQMESRRVATERGSYAPRRIKPADARSDDPFWCRERNGEWHLRTYYQIENECHPGSWKMDAEAGYLVFHRE